MRLIFCLKGFILALPLMLLSASTWANEDHVVTAEAGDADEAIQSAINAVSKVGGGRVLLKSGTYVLHRGLTLTNVRGVSVVGEKGARLVMAPEVWTLAAEQAPQGQDFLLVESADKFTAGMPIEIQAKGLLDTAPSGHKHQRLFFGATVAAVEGRRLRLKRPLEYTVPKGTRLLYTYNAFALWNGSSNITIEGLEIDLNRTQWPVKPLNHTSHCGVMAAGPYDYTKGVTGKLIEGIAIRNCVIRNCHHRGIAWYSVVKSAIIACRIENADAEGIDFDHFAEDCVARDNVIRNCPVAVELNDALNCVVERNSIEQCGKGINLWRWCLHAHLNLGNIFRDNVVLQTKGTGIFCGQKTGKTLITGNTIQDASKGIHVAGDENIVEKNTVSACRQEGLLISGHKNVLRGNEVRDCLVPLKDVGSNNIVEQ